MRTTLAIMFTAIALSAPAANHAHASTNVYDRANPWVGVNPHAYPNPGCVIYLVNHPPKDKHHTACNPMVPPSSRR